jgi:ribonuclease HI
MLDVSHNGYIRKHFRKIYEEAKFMKLETIIIKYKISLKVKSCWNQLMVSETQHAMDNIKWVKGEAKQTDNQEFSHRLILLLQRNIVQHPVLNYSTYSDPFRLQMD